MNSPIETNCHKFATVADRDNYKKLVDSATSFPANDYDKLLAQCTDTLGILSIFFI